MICDANALAALLPRLRAAEWLALDTEADSLHAYPEKVCLVQISLPGADELVDPLAGFDLAPLWEALRGRRLILHGADYDLRLLQEHHWFTPHAVFDTMIAARLAGIQRFGLGDLVEQFLGVKLDKAPQKSDWAVRPLSPRLLNYARHDTHFLKALTDMLETRLREQGRLGWCEESCARLIEECSRPVTPDPDLVWRIKGSGRLSRPALAVLRELWPWREREAVALNRPPFFVMMHETLLGISVAAAHGENWEKLLPRRCSVRRHEEISEAVHRGATVPPEKHPQILRAPCYHPTESEKRQFDELKLRRDKRAGELGIDPTLIASRQTLELLSRHRNEDEWKRLMSWQRELLK
ncbi:MAG: HRDC domain-containing protein [Verrucomicrobia bacterium]|nr:HRDC domain-containing protein [Verrucomicrobiota bacterium]